MSRRRTVWTVTAVVAVVLVTLVGLGAFALARSDGRFGPWHDRWGPSHHGFGGPTPEQVVEARADLARDLGAELDVPAERVETAFRAVVAQRLRDAVAAGHLEQSDADEALAAYDAGELRMLFHLLKRDR